MEKIKTSIFWLTLALCVLSVYGMKNPSTMYCEALGYSYEIKQNENGDDIGVCAFPKNADCNAWDFMLGKCGTDYSYCAKMGYSQKTGKGVECGSEYPQVECLVCVLPNGTNAEVTSLMNLDVNEGKCGDGSCVLGETHESCPQDCPATTLEEITTMPVEETTTWTPITTLPPETTIQPPESTTLPKETTTLPPEASTTTTPEGLCGNGVCDPTEDFDSCPKDCSKSVGTMDYLPYIVIIAVLLAIIFVVKKKLDEKKIEKERAEFEKWKQEKGGSTL